MTADGHQARAKGLEITKAIRHVQRLLLLNDDKANHPERKVHVNRKRLIVSIEALVCGLLVSACGETGDSEADGLPEASSGLPQPFLGVSPSSGGPAGIVLETMNAEAYTYARVGAGEEEVWVAGPIAEIAEGDTVSLLGAGNMGSFTSRSLDRTFEEIYFIDEFRIADPTASTFQGTVTETMNAAEYTYVQVNVGEELSWMTPPDTDEPLVWLAGPETVVSVGDVVSWQGGSVMKEFRSNTLERTFTEIVFVGSITVVN
jgi:hypothetical protein